MVRMGDSECSPDAARNLANPTTHQADALAITRAPPDVLLVGNAAGAHRLRWMRLYCDKASYRAAAVFGRECAARGRKLGDGAGSVGPAGRVRARRGRGRPECREPPTAVPRRRAYLPDRGSA